LAEEALGLLDEFGEHEEVEDAGDEETVDDDSENMPFTADVCELAFQTG
jgi:hypothetical protein